MVRLLLISYLLLSVTFNPWQITTFLPIKNFLLQFFLILSAIFLLTKKYILFPLSYLYYLVLVFWFWIILHIRIFSLRDSYFFLLLLPILPLIVSNIKKRDIDKIFYLIVILGTLLSIYGVFQYFGIDFSFWHGNISRNRVFGLFGNVNYFAIYLVPSFCLSLFYLFNKRGVSKIFFFIIFLFNLLAIFFTFTRSVYLGSFISLIYILFIYKVRPKKKWVWTFLFLLFIFFIVVYRYELFNKMILLLAHRGSIERRFFLWRIGFSMIDIKTLFLGKGLGFYGYMFPYYQGLFVRSFNIYRYPSSVSFYPHNEYLGFLIELGIFGVLLFLGIVYFFLRQVLIEKDNLYSLTSSSVIIAYLVISFFSFPLHLPVSSFFFWFFISIPSVFTERKRLYLPFFVKIVGIFILCIILFLYMNFYISHSYAFYKKYEDVKNLNPFWGEIRGHLGVRYLKKGELDKGFEELKKAKESYTDFSIYYNLGVLYFQKGEYRKAKEIFQYTYFMAKSKLDRANVLKFLGVIYSILGKKGKAYETLKISIKLNPKDPETYYNLALVCKDMGKIDEYKDFLKMGLKCAKNGSKLKNIMLKMMQNL